MIRKSPCEYCQSVAELRPYGREGARICFECGMKPQNKKTTQAQFERVLNRAEVEGCGVTILGDGTPRPYLGEFGDAPGG